MKGISMNKERKKIPFLWTTASNLRTVKHCFTAVFLIMAVIFTVIVSTSGTTAAAGDDIGDQTVFPDVTMSGITDASDSFGPETVSEYPLTVINVWDTTCGFCIQEMPDINKAAAMFSNDVNVIGICYDTRDSGGDTDGQVNDDVVALASSILKLRGVSYKNYIPSAEFQKYLLSLDCFSGFPTTFFIDRNSNIVKIVTGSLTYDGWVNTISSVLDDVS